MPTTVASSPAIPEPRTVAARTQRPRAELKASGSGAGLALGVPVGALTAGRRAS